MEEKYINIEIYTFLSRRVRIYTPTFLGGFFRFTAISKVNYEEYLRTIAVVARTVEHMGFQDKVNFAIRPWSLWFWKAFLKGVYHSPAVIINGGVVSSGNVPYALTIKKVLAKIEKKHSFLNRE